MEFAALNKCNVIIFGDLNIDLLATSNVKTNLIEIMSFMGVKMSLINPQGLLNNLPHCLMSVLQVFIRKT